MTTESVTLESPRSGRWEAVAFLADESERDLAAPHPDLCFRLVRWFDIVKLLHEWENEESLGHSPPENLKRAHQCELAKLIAIGAYYLQRLRENDVTAQIGVTLADVEATLEELCITQREWYGGMTEKRRAQVLDEVFSGT